MLAIAAVRGIAPEQKPLRCTVAIDAGHSSANPGAVSARGVPEHEFNVAIARVVLDDLKTHGSQKSFIVDGARDSLQDRAAAAAHGGADVLVSLHHDSVQAKYLSTWTYNGRKRRFSDRFSGYSLFYSEKNPRNHKSLELAKRIGEQLVASGFRPTLHHAEPIAGENRDLVDRRLGIYRFDDLILLKSATIPAVLIECGLIVNRDEEQRLTSPAYRGKLVRAIVEGVGTFCEGRSMTAQPEALDGTW